MDKKRQELALHSQHQHTCQRLRRTPQNLREFTEFTAPGILLEDAMSVPYWLGVIRQLRVNDIINLIADDDSFDVTLRVVCLGNNVIEFRILREWRPEIDETDDAEATGHHLAVVGNLNSGMHAA